MILQQISAPQTKGAGKIVNTMRRITSSKAPSRLLSEFILDPDWVYLNHGSFGACPKPVFDAYQYWQRELERQPTEFLGRRIKELLEDSRKSLAVFLNTRPQDVVFFPNPTTAVNMVVRNLNLNPGDEILTTDHEYGAMLRTWRYTCVQTGAKLVIHPVALPVNKPEEFVSHLWRGVSEKTRVIFLSHITSPTALIFPVGEICQMARDAGILTLIDGAHAPGQIPINLHILDADLYTGALHKWLCAPKGASFLFARPEIQAWLDPLVVSWGYEAEKPSSSQYLDYHEWQGTRDMAAFLSVPMAISFQKEYGWEHVREYCHDLVRIFRIEMTKLTGLPSIAPDEQEINLNYRWYGQMGTVRLPPIDPQSLHDCLAREYRIEVPVFAWNGESYLRISVQAYNMIEDIHKLINALRTLLPRLQSS